ncbi:MAG: Similar to F420-dependent glucose-6-phosphate dehydrogenase, Mext_1273 family, partial [uncultured Phycisphaerae bacterium]
DRHHRVPRVARAVRPEPAAEARAARGPIRVRGRHVLGPLQPVGRAAGAERVRLVVARGGFAGRPGVDVRDGQRPRPAVPPGHHRPGGRHAGRDVPRPAVVRVRQRAVPERAHHRPAVADQGRAERAAAGVGRGDAG